MLTFIATLAIVVGQASARDALLARLAGEWISEGRVLDQPARVQLKWEWTLDDRFMRLTFANDMGERRFEGHAYYKALGSGRFRGWWFDNSGMMRPIDATKDADTLVAAWGTEETERGETSYRLNRDGSMEIVDRVLGRDGQWREFGRVIARRALGR